MKVRILLKISTKQIVLSK